jgi:hypothetical protein
MFRFHSVLLLTQKCIAGRVVRTVNVGMTVRTAAVEILYGTQWLRLGGVPAAVVTGITNTRHTYFEELRVIRAMGFMAICTILHDRRMFPEERSPAFRVAAETILVDGALDELAGIRRAMRIMATRAGNLAFTVGHVRGPLQLRATHGMTPQAQFRLLLFHPGVFRERLAESRI